jgi:hypothetical protein
VLVAGTNRGETGAFHSGGPFQCKKMALGNLVTYSSNASKDDPYVIKGQNINKPPFIDKIEFNLADRIVHL